MSAGRPGMYDARVYRPQPPRPPVPAPAAARRPQPAPPAVEWLTVAEVAAQLRVSKMTVYRLIHDGALPAVRVRRSFRVDAAGVDQYLDQAEERP